MKKVLIITVMVGIAAFLQSNVMLPTKAENSILDKSAIEMPDDVKAVVDKSCFGCHNKDSRNEKGKDKFKWDELNELSKAKQVAALDGVIEVIKENEMPPEKFLEKYPDNAPSKADKKLLVKWANKQAEKILGE